MTTRYPFSAIKEKLAARRGKAMDFAIGQRRIPLPAAIDDWIRAHLDLAMKPGTATEAKAFSEAAAQLLLREYGVDIAPQYILPTPGGRAAMSAFVACALEPGQLVLVTEPGYPAFARLARHRHARILELELDPEQGFAPDLESFAAAAQEAPRVIALNYPNNPTGATLSLQSIASLQRISSPATILFNDATYGPLVYGEQPTSILHADVANTCDMAFVELHSFSKLFPIGPVAASFLAGSAATMDDVTTYSEFAWSPLSSLQLQATTLCLRNAERLHELRDFFPRQLEQLTTTLKSIGFAPYPAPSGVYAMCPTPASIAGKAVASAAEAAAMLMDNFDLAVVPWDAPRHSYLRFAALYQPEDLERLALLGDGLQLA